MVALMKDAGTKTTELKLLFLTLFCFVFTGNWECKRVSRSSDHKT